MQYAHVKHVVPLYFRELPKYIFDQGPLRGLSIFWELINYAKDHKYLDYDTCMVFIWHLGNSLLNQNIRPKVIEEMKEIKAMLESQPTLDKVL